MVFVKVFQAVCEPGIPCLRKAKGETDMNVFIVYAHPDAKSFNHALKDIAFETLTDAGHRVTISDLYAMDFNPILSRRDFRKPPGDRQEDLEDQQADDRRDEGIQAEQEKLKWCDFLVLQFPLWWFSMPAIMKGWVDRVFTMDFAYSKGLWYNEGMLQGRKAMLSITTGGARHMFTTTGIHGPVDEILFHIHHGMLYYVGFQVLPPFIVWQPGRFPDLERKRYIEQYRQRLLNLESIKPISYPELEDYDANYQLKPRSE
jgi:NAD(P)H dehydrogenase (quinone)